MEGEKVTSVTGNDVLLPLWEGDVESSVIFPPTVHVERKASVSDVMKGSRLGYCVKSHNPDMAATGFAVLQQTASVHSPND